MGIVYIGYSSDISALYLPSHLGVVGREAQSLLLSGDELWSNELVPVVWPEL